MQVHSNVGNSTGCLDYLSGCTEADVEKLFSGAEYFPGLESPRLNFLLNAACANSSNPQGPVARLGNSSRSAAVTKPPSTTSSRQDFQNLFAIMTMMEQRMINLENVVASSLDGNYTAMSMTAGTAHQIHHLDSAPSMRDLDIFCSAEFAKEYEPTSTDLSRMHQALSSQFPGVGRRNILSAVRKWYRKKRDENGQKVFTKCIAIIQPLINEGVGIEIIRERLKNENDTLYKRMLSETNLDIKNPERARAFLQAKVESYFTRRVLISKAQ